MILRSSARRASQDLRFGEGGEKLGLGRRGGADDFEVGADGGPLGVVGRAEEGEGGDSHGGGEV